MKRALGRDGAKRRQREEKPSRQASARAASARAGVAARVSTRRSAKLREEKRAGMVLLRSRRVREQGEGAAFFGSFASRGSPLPSSWRRKSRPGLGGGADRRAMDG